jgi:hypothetical protein
MTIKEKCQRACMAIEYVKEWLEIVEEDAGKDLLRVDDDKMLANIEAYLTSRPTTK